MIFEWTTCTCANFNVFLILAQGVSRSLRKFSLPRDLSLGPISLDYGFLEEMKTETECDGLELKPLNEALMFLDNRKNFWKKQDPKHYKPIVIRREMRI